MTIESRLEKIFVEVLEISGPVDKNLLRYNEFDNWNSLGHMSLIAAIENEFDIIFETEDILAMSDFEVAVRIVKKYVDD